MNLKPKKIICSFKIVKKKCCLNGHGLFDLRRWANAASVMNEYIANESCTITKFGAKSKTVEAKHTVLPIPLTAIDFSGGILQQNDGY